MQNRATPRPSSAAPPALHIGTRRLRLSLEDAREEAKLVDVDLRGLAEAQLAVARRLQLREEHGARSLGLELHEDAVRLAKLPHALGLALPHTRVAHCRAARTGQARVSGSAACSGSRDAWASAEGKRDHANATGGAAGELHAPCDLRTMTIADCAPCSVACLRIKSAQLPSVAGVLNACSMPMPARPGSSAAPGFGRAGCR
mmetsp:Transcript_68777/g.206277  ORF Transcript_68777/g.206277 Transcript_68777/m.206277 type:complete len:202 (+) Transcript_68777:255-860(+)